MIPHETTLVFKTVGEVNKFFGEVVALMVEALSYSLEEFYWEFKPPSPSWHFGCLEEDPSPSTNQ